MNGKIKFKSNDTAVITVNEKISYTGIGSQIAAMTGYLKTNGIKKNTYTGVLLNNSPDFIAAVFALWKLDAVPVLLNIKLTSKEIDELLASSNVKNVITNNKYADKLTGSYTSLNIDSGEIKSKSEDPGTILINSVVIFTSGTSGFPKGVLLNSGALISSIKTGNTVLHQNESDRWLASLPFYHIGGLMIFLRAFTFGASVILPETLRLEEIKHALENLHPTLASLVPTQLQRLIEGGVKPGNELRNLLLGGGVIEQSLIKDALNKGWLVSAVYGSTETSSFVAYMPAEELRKNPGSSGRAVPPNKIEIIDSGVIEGDPSGEIVIESPSLFEKYLNNPEETSGKLVNGRYFTGDYGFLDRENYLYVQSRRSDMIVSGGENIDPAEVEIKLMQFPGITDACVFGRKNNEWGEVVNAAIVADESTTDDDITDYLKKDLARYKIPKQYFRVTEIPRTALGKIRREKIKNMLNQP